MKKKIKKLNIFSSLSFLPLMPLVAASCKKNDNDEKIQIINNESNPQTSKQMTPPNSHGDQSKDDSSNVDKTTDAKNNNEKSEPTVTPKDQSDESRSEAGKNDNDNSDSRTNNTPEMPNDGSNNTYKIPMNNDKEEKQKKLEEERKQKEQEDKNNVEEVKKIIEEQKDAFGSFHTQNEFVDQINVYAKDKNINGLILQNNEDKDKKLIVDTDGGKNNKIKLQLGSQKFEIQLGIVLKDAVITKYYIDEDSQKGQIKTNIFKREGVTTINKDWNSIKNGKKIVVIQLGYHKDWTGIQLTVLPHYTSKVPRNLPLKINSINWSFYNLVSPKVDNLNEWDTSNIKSAEEAFLDAKELDQSLKNWKIRDSVNIKNMFKGAHKMKTHLKDMATAWKTTEDKLI
ncbi:BspA family leucine-rich repeat surface protein [Mycoplasmopsis bovis]|uniref:BspA family leucine-rich repeat surface protein n=1 Tax=Mycoplasmopsis bovis TaxID=28903 RepID=UPI001CF5D540|nr:BspA family leucine-rich repeat surface protein [Mycoplasmopsis bovis]MCA8838776.1 BspA family leucine-rich repeat surface protein [Mycoplasmopsis bovis]MCA8862157.1 BspA family leucine-rich repeat surface protein [Mycoplasmopsis bovis]WEI90211.1 BspA family leucine-rich repeat surface protein [Mycoplasmopsis bovis]